MLGYCDAAAAAHCPPFLSSLAQICPTQGGKKDPNLSPPFKLNKPASWLLPQAARPSSTGSSVAVRRLFCARKLGCSSESSCYSRKVVFFFFLPTPNFHFSLVLISRISLERKRCLAYCSSGGEETALPFPHISSPTGVMFAHACSAIAVSFHRAAFG